MPSTTNAVKAQLIAATNAVLGLLAAFNVVGLTDAQQGAILLAVNALFSLLVAVSYKASHKRIPDDDAAA